MNLKETWRRRTRTERWLIILIGVLLVLIAVRLGHIRSRAAAGFGYFLEKLK